MRKFLLSLMAPKICQIGDVILTRKGEAYWVQPGRLIQMRVMRVPNIKPTEEKPNE